MGFGMSDPSELDPKKLIGLLDKNFVVPDEIGTVQGWRAWQLDRDPPAYGTAPRLHSATYQYYWAPKVKARAECSRCTSEDPTDSNHVPGTTCSCGFYSAKTLEQLRRMGYHTYDESGGRVCVIGKLANWGRVIEGSQGWRAEFAYPLEIYVPFEAWKLAKPIAKAYGVPVKLLNLLDPDALPGQARELRWTS